MIIYKNKFYFSWNINGFVYFKVRGILNKLTPEKFQKLTDDLLKIDLNSAVILNGVIYLIFEKALDEPKYSSMYAQLCKRLSKEAPNFEPAGAQNCTFLRLLLNVSRDKFEKRAVHSDLVNQPSAATLSKYGGGSGSGGSSNSSNNGAATPPLSTDDEEKKHVVKQKMLGNVKFIGELCKLDMLSDNTLHLIIQSLLELEIYKRQTASLQDKCEDTECLCQLVRTCGKILDTEKVIIVVIVNS